MDKLVGLMVAKSIYSRTELYLLCFVNGVVCELCLINHVRHVQKGTDIFACWNCVTTEDTPRMIGTKECKTVIHSKILGIVLSNGRLTTNLYRN